MPSNRPTAAGQLRRAFLDFFVKNEHVEVPSSPLVPNDPSLLFTTAGMVQFKPYYTTAGEVPYTRATSVQKCLRLTDLDNVGMTPRHATFFEMLGNFSFGPKEKGAYFKDEAIAFAWEFVTKELGLPPARLYPSVFAGEGPFPRDDEAIALWKKLGVPESRIVPLGRADNFWGPAGGQGACGPCSEIYFDLGETRPDYLAPGAFWGERPGDPGDRYMEFWNLVFPQFDAQADGTMKPLARPGIDTGMGLDRLAMIMQDKRTIHDTDLLKPLVDHVMSREHRTPRDEPLAQVGARIIADHARALTFAIAEGALPGNEGAGYVLRRLLRRAVARSPSANGPRLTLPVMAQMAERIVGLYGGHYPELISRAGVIDKVLRQEEDNFAVTFESGLARLETLLASGAKTLAGADAFMLHDTFGFPIELTQEIASERGVAVDAAGFEREMEAQRTRARAASKFEKGHVDAEKREFTPVTEGPDSSFTGYESVFEAGVALRSWRPAAEDTYEVILDHTPFYAESGGQVADHGMIRSAGVDATVEHVFKAGAKIVHRIRLPRGGRDDFERVGRSAALVGQVDSRMRQATMRHHTATHMLHAALRETLGSHVRQAGSLVAPNRLRFDYEHFEAPTPEQLARIEGMVVTWVLGNAPVSWREMPIDQAKAMGAMALFGEKYGDRVRMVTVEGVPGTAIPVSRELCGGTHVSATGEIGTFILVSDSAIASGVRRVEALCGLEALGYLQARNATLEQAAAMFQVKPEAVPEQIEKLRGELAALRKAQTDAQRGGLEAEMARIAASATVAPGGRWAVAEITVDADANTVRDAADTLRGALQRGAVVLAVKAGGKLTFVAAVTDDLVAAKLLRADELVRAVAQVTGGSGGGKPHLALAGGKDASKLNDALTEARRLLTAALGA